MGEQKLTKTRKKCLKQINDTATENRKTEINMYNHDQGWKWYRTQYPKARRKLLTAKKVTEGDLGRIVLYNSPDGVTHIRPPDPASATFWR